MAIRVKANNSLIGEELNSKLGALGLEIVVDEETQQIVDPKDRIEDKKKKEKKDKK